MTRLLAVAALMLLVTGCATRASYHRLQADVATLRGEVTDLRQAQDVTARELNRSVAEGRALDARLGEVTTAQRATGTDVAALRGRVETAEAELREAKARAAAATPPPAPPGPAPVVEVPREPVARPDGAEQAYQAALATFRAREYGQAVLDFLDFIAKRPKHALVANAQYWIGEAYYVQRDFRQAMTEFQKVSDVAPGSPKVPDALLKVGLCYRSLRDESRARQMWDRVAKDYPKSEAASKARALLRTKAATVKR